MAAAPKKQSLLETVFGSKSKKPASSSSLGDEDTEDMSMKEVLTLSPWQKFRKYGRLPAKLVLHIALMILLIIQIVFVFQQFTVYDRNSRTTFLDAFTNENVSDGIATVQEVLDTISWTVSTFYSFPGDSIGMFTFINATQGGIQPVYMKIKGSNASGIYALSQADSLGPFGTVNASQIQQWFADIEYVWLWFEYANVNYGPYGRVNCIWTLKVKLTDSEQGGLLNYGLDVNRRVVGKAHSLIVFTLLDVVVLLMSAVSFLLTVRVIVNRTKLFKITRDFFHRLPPATLRSFKYHSWDDIPLGVKLGFYSFWSATSIVANLLLIGATLMNLCNRGYQVNSTGYFVMYGLGVLLTFVNLLRYMEYYEKFYILILTLKLAFPRVVRTIASALPIFFGYVLVGVILFSPFSERFQNFDHTSVTLFALINGDEIMATFGELSDVYPHLIISRVYLYTFIALFITAVLNIFIFIIEDAFKAAKVLGKDPAAIKRKRLEKMDLKKLLDMIEEQLAAEDTAPYTDSSGSKDPAAAMALGSASASSLGGGGPASRSLSSSLSASTSSLGKKPPPRYRFSRVVKKVMEQQSSGASSLSSSTAELSSESRKASTDSTAGALNLTNLSAAAQLGRSQDDDAKKALLAKEKDPAIPITSAFTVSSVSSAAKKEPPKLRLSQMLWGEHTPVASGSSPHAPPSLQTHTEPISPRAGGSSLSGPSSIRAAAAGPSEGNAQLYHTVLQNQQAFMAELLEETEHLKERYIAKLRVELEQLLLAPPSQTHSINMADE